MHSRLTIIAVVALSLGCGGEGVLSSTARDEAELVEPPTKLEGDATTDAASPTPESCAVPVEAPKEECGDAGP